MHNSTTTRHMKTTACHMKWILSFALLCGSQLLAEDPHQIDSKRASRDAQSDTDPKSGFWRDAPVVVARSDRQGNPVPGYQTEIRSRWTGTNLYFLFTCPYEKFYLKPNPDAKAETNELWKWDVAEVFIGSDFKNIRKYREFEVSPQSEWVDLDIDLDSPHHEDGWIWNSGFKVSTRVDEAAKTWYAFMQIPYSSVDSRSPAAGNTLRVNFFLSEGERPAHKSVTWQPTGKPSFHVPEAFGTLKLVN